MSEKDEVIQTECWHRAPENKGPGWISGALICILESQSANLYPLILGYLCFPWHKSVQAPPSECGFLDV